MVSSLRPSANKIGVLNEGDTYRDSAMALSSAKIACASDPRPSLASARPADMRKDGRRPELAMALSATASASCGLPIAI
jgi:hypothetical protein